MSSNDGSAQTTGNAAANSGAPLEISARWARPLVAASGGEATLLVRVAGGAGAPPEGGARRPPVDVSFVLDRSGSMAGKKLALVKKAVDVAIGHLGDDDRAALVVYDHSVQTLHHLAAATPRTKTAIRLALHGVDPGGSTNLAGGWLTGCGELGQEPARPAGNGAMRIRRALLLTDGLANVGIVDAAELTAHADALRQRGVGTTTLGVGLDFDEALLSGMAEAGGGNFQFIERADELRAFFAREVNDLLTVTAAGLRLSLTLPPEVAAALVNPFPCERQGDRIEVALGDLPASDELHLVFLVRVPAGPVGTAHRVAMTATWADPAADVRRTTDLAPARLLLADPATVALAALDPDIAEQAALQRAAAERRAAMRLDRAGRYDDARARMRAAADALRAAPMTAAIMDELRVTANLAAAPASAPYAEDVRKRATFDAFRRARGKTGRQ